MFFLSVMDYGDILYMRASAATLKPLDAVYHSALRFITVDNDDTHHCELYAKVGWPSLSIRRDGHWVLFIFKAFTGFLSPYITLLLSFNAGPYRTCS